MSTGGRRGAEKPTFGVEMSRFEFEFEFESRRRHVDRSMRGPIWSDLGHPGLPDLVASTLMDASNSHADDEVMEPEMTKIRPDGAEHRPVVVSSSRDRLTNDSDG